MPERVVTDERIIVFVQDTGIGIAPEHTEVIFESIQADRWLQYKEIWRHRPWIAICRNLVQMMGGRIWVDSELGEGALFQVELPRVGTE